MESSILLKWKPVFLGFWIRVFFISVFSAPLGAGAFADSETRALPNLVFVVTDDQRADTLGALGNTEILTPSLDRLVRAGVTFRRAYSGYPICYASRAQILTGCNVFTALENYPRSQIREGLDTLADTLSGAGYSTFYCGKWHNDGNPLVRGYQHTAALYSAGGAKHVKMPSKDPRGMPLTGYRGWTFKNQQNEAMLEYGVGLQPNNSRVIGDAVVDVIRNSPADESLFLHVNFAFPHDPRMWPEHREGIYQAATISLPHNFRTSHDFDHGNQGGRDETLLPKPLDKNLVREELAIYYAMVSDVDHQVGRILESLEETNRLSNTLFVFTSDQGLALGSHGLLGKQNQYEHSIRSPLVIAGPEGLCANSPRVKTSESDEKRLLINHRVDTLVELSDLFPTLCDYAGISIPESVEGKSLLPIMTGKEDAVRDLVFGVFTDSQRMVCGQRWKYIEYPLADRQQLFDVQNDPSELENRISDDSLRDVVSELKNQLNLWRRKNRDPMLRETHNR